jgi:DNA helicase II / ATP-dependent DNA helicase PcrA
VDILDGLNPEQRRAAEAVRGPVCILAGAGSGKTTTITRRIANQVATGAFRAEQILAVTFTDKAAGELRERLGALGVRGVRASTFHSAALAQLRHFAPESVGRIFPSKALALRQIGNSLPAPFKFRPAGDLATEVEWAKNRRIAPDRYLAELGEHEPPIPADLMVKVYRSYEARKAEQGTTDFEDLLELAVRLYERDPAAVAGFRARYAAFTVDEYQDVNLLQRTLLDLWLGDRDDLCVVGDDYQSIYAFTGAGPEHLLGTPARFPQATVVRLEENYRSTPQVLALANRLVPRLSGA